MTYRGLSAVEWEVLAMASVGHQRCANRHGCDALEQGAVRHVAVGARALRRLSWRHRCAMASGICWNLVFNYCRLYAARYELGRLKSIDDTIVLLLFAIVTVIHLSFRRSHRMLPVFVSSCQEFSYTF